VIGYFDDLSPRRAQSLGYFGAPARNAAPELTPQQREALMSTLGARSIQTAELLFDIIDTPASYVRDILAGERLGNRTTPGHMLDSMGLRPSKEALGGWGRPVAEFVAGALPDPLNLVGIGSIGQAGKAAKGIRTAANLNLLDDASRVMSRRLIESNNLASRHARNALDSWSSNFGKQASDLTDADLLARPLAGPRESRRGLTLQDLVEDRSLLDPATGAWQARRSAAEQAELIAKIENQGIKYADVAGDSLRQDIGLGLPFSDANLIGTNIPGGEWLAKGLDKTGQAIRWSSPARHAYATFSRDMFGAVEEGGQIVGKEVANAIRGADAASGRAIADALQDLQPDVLNNEQLSASMRRILGGYGEAADLDLITRGSATFRPDLKKFVDDWAAPGGLKETYLARRMDAGLPSQGYASRYSGEYFPRHIDDLSFQSRIEAGLAGGGRSRGGRAFSTLTPDMIARRKYLDVPGGEDFINRLGLDPNVAGPNRAFPNGALQTIEDAAQYIYKEVENEARRRYPSGRLPNGQPVPKYNMDRARRMADFLSKLDDTSIKAKLPIFGSHFTDDFARYVKGNERSLAITDTLTELMAGSAKNQKARLVPGGLHVPLRQAARNLGLQTVNTATPGATPLMMRAGIEPNLLARLAKRFPGQVNELKNFSLDERMVQRLTRIADFYDYPEVQKGWLKFFDDYTRLWKASILAFPARFTRDWYSGGFSNAVEVGVGTELWHGYTGARHLIQGDMDKLDAIIGMAPRYRGMAKATRLREFQNDLAAGGLLGGRRAADFADTRSSLQSGKDVADEFLPGMNPRTTLGYQAWDLLSLNKPRPVADAAYSELGKNWNRIADVGWKRPRDIGNPVLRWSQRLGDTTDSINRSAGYIGLLLKGIDPLEAAARMKAAHVDYASLTTIEREAFRRFIPFWSFTSRIGKWVATKLYEKPGGRFSQFGLRAPDTFLQTEDDDYVPESIRSSYGMPISPSYARPFGQQQEGATPWLTKIALPGIQELNMFRLGFDQHGTPEIGRTAWNTAVDSVGRMAHPAVKSGIEAVSGINLFTNRPYKEFTPAINEIAQEAGIHPDSVYGQYISRAAPFVDLVPFVSRPMQIANRLLDADKVPDFHDRLYQMGINATTGFSIQNVTDEQRSIDARREIGDMLRDNRLVRAFTQPYIPEAAKPYADPQLLEMMALERTLGQEANAARDLREGRPVKAARRRRNTADLSYFE
jgi:hypothetical protein